MDIIFPGENENPFLLFWVFIFLSGPTLGILIGILTRFEMGFVIGTFIPALIGFVFAFQYHQEYKMLTHPGSNLYQGKVIDVEYPKYDAKTSDTISKPPSEPVIRFITNKNRVLVFHGGPRDDGEYKINYQVAILYDTSNNKVIWTYNVSMLKIRALVLMVISTFLFIIGQIPGMEIITDIARDLKATRKKKYANPNKNVRGTLSIIWENLLNENRNLPIEKEREISPQLKSLNSKLIPIFNILLFLSLVIPGFFDNLHLGISIGYGLFSSSILGMIIRELFNPNRSLQLCYGLFLFWIIVSTILFAMRA
ncbi:hypothetical protein [Leptospira borgpetersenii]|uniref:Membrane protein n=4 Tax=Leptospira borgpetersenii TaxID=174 RepID=A0AAV3JDJ3_LEPBO|nr:hypothetical protein [Leptospira borgpetersenii]ALO24475.1 putative membrane protein [Leptospira borgpetersenii serovar Ballum]ANG99640.2 Putative membrane protein [Leptospira borgpetersenii str. 4E]EKQ91957.1 putative membrane protein [Leptospira borgpetersenii str. UI 09149]EKR01725.1 putative membrane protein [Leptospira borgpetersenii serovar Castellonis str. 200801910]EPG58294.1 putative membrane protein [Leptospira borgpetersenii serovar Javanica str. UI 09931]